MKNKKTEKKFNIFFGIDEKYEAAIILAVYFILLIPVIYLGKYNFMQADDYNYGDLTHQAYVHTNSYFEVIKAGFETVDEAYYTWQGTFSSIFLMSVYPSVVNYRFYKIVPAIMVSLITLSAFALSYTLICKVLKNKVTYAVVAASFLALMMVERLYTVPSALYWYNAASHYTIAQCSFFLLVVVYINSVLTKNKGLIAALIAISVILGLEVGGSNYSTVVIAGVSMISLFVLLVILKKTKALVMLPSLIVQIAGTIVNVTAPGNKVRGGYYAGMGPVQSILNSFKSFFKYSAEWMDLYTFVILLLLIPVFWNIATSTDYKFRFPYLVIIASICIISSGFASSFYSLGNSGLSRTQNVIKETWQVLLLVNEAYLVGWIRKRYFKNKKEIKTPLVAFLLGLAILLIQPAVLKDLGTVTSYIAFDYLRYGFASAFWNENMERLKILEDDSIEDAVLDPHTVKPFYLFVSDITTDEDNWENKGMASYYGKNSVVLSAEDTVGKQ